MRKTWLGLALIVVSISASMFGTAQTPAWFAAGNHHCSVAQGTPDNRTFACQVWNGDPQLFRTPLQLEIYRGKEKVFTIDTGEPILEWHFWNDGSQLSVHYRAQNSQRVYVLYDTATSSEVDAAGEPDRPIQLPQWAKTRTQIEDEAVPESAAMKAQRTAWIAKLMRQLQAIHPGMKREDLDTLFTTEGGKSTRFERTYVSRECPYIKVNVRFKHMKGETDAVTEKPDDAVESVSPPYLGWSIMD